MKIMNNETNMISDWESIKTKLTDSKHACLYVRFEHPKDYRILDKVQWPDLSELEDSIRKYYIATIDKAPKLSDFYVPSEEQKNGELKFVVGFLALLGFVAYKYA